MKKQIKTPKNDILTKGKFIPVFEEIKDLIKSSAKSTETFLGGKIALLEKRLDATQEIITEFRREVKNEIQGVRTELKTEIQGVRTELKTEIQGVRTELKTEIHEMGNRLSGVEKHVSDISGKMDKIDSIAGHVDDHETRITSLENART